VQHICHLLEEAQSRNKHLLSSNHSPEEEEEEEEEVIISMLGTEEAELTRNLREEAERLALLLVAFQIRIDRLGEMRKGRTKRKRKRGKPKGRAKNQS
jgi:hypothetical protein